MRGGRFIVPEEEAQIIVLGIEIGELPPGHVVLQVAPDPLDWGQLGAIRGSEEQTDVVREGGAGKRDGPLLASRSRLRRSGKAWAKG